MLEHRSSLWVKLLLIKIKDKSFKFKLKLLVDKLISRALHMLTTPNYSKGNLARGRCFFRVLDTVIISSRRVSRRILLPVLMVFE